MYFFGKLCAIVGFCILAYRELDKTFCRKDTCKLSNGKVSLVIDDENMVDYLETHPNDENTFVLTIPNDVDIVMFNTSKKMSVHNIFPQTGDFDNGKEIKVCGNFSPYMPNSSDNEEYTFSTHIYQDMSRNNGSTTLDLEDENCIEIMCWRKLWWFTI